MELNDFVFSFADDNHAQRARLAASLRAKLLESAAGAEIVLGRTDSEAMDMGSVVTIASAVLSSGALLAIAKGVQAWLARHHGVSLRLRRPDGTEVEIQDATEAAILEALRVV